MTQLDTRPINGLGLANWIPPAAETDHDLTNPVSGEALIAGDPVYLKSDGKIWKADADSAGKFPALGIAFDDAASGAVAPVLFMGLLKNAAWSWTVAGLVYLSTSSGLTQTQPSATDNAIQIMGIALGTDLLYVNPQLVWITHV